MNTPYLMIKSSELLERQAWRLALVMAVLIFALDSRTPLEFAHGVLYLPVVFLAMLSRRIVPVLWLAVVCTVLIVAGFFLSPPITSSPSDAFAWLNRALALVALWLVALMATASTHFSLALERARARALSQSQLLEIASDLGQLGGWEFDVARRQVRWTPEIARLHGRPLGFQPTLDEGVEHYAPEHRAIIRERFDACVREGVPFDEQLRLNLTSGEQRWVRVVGRAVMDRHGVVVRVQGAFQDIGHQKAAEMRLADSLHAWRRLAETLPMIVWTASLDGRIDYVSQAIFSFSGVQPSVVLRDNWLDVIHPADRDRLLDRWSEALASGQAFEVECRVRRRDGEYRWHLSRATRVRPSTDAEEIWYGTMVNIHGRIGLERDLRDAVERYQSVFTSVTDAIVALDSQWRMTVMNPQAEMQVNLRAADALGRVFWDVFPETRGTIFQQEFERCMNERTVIRMQEFYAPLGKRFEITAYPARDGISIYFRDVTAEHRLAEQLRQAQRLEAIGQLTGGVAHDFNNLLTVVMGNAEMLLDDLPAESPLRPLACVIGEAASRGAAMTQRLLAFARKQPLSPQAVDTNQLVRDMDGLMRRSLGEHIEIELVLCTGLWQALVDPGQLENALLNLAVNARDAMPSGGKLTIETNNVRLDTHFVARQPGLSEGQYVTLVVSDTGYGMAPEVTEHIFEPFFTTKPKGQGTGLGLAMVHGFARQSNGHVAVHSEIGQGSTFKLYLPRCEANEPAARREVDTAMPRGQSELVLLVEDDELVRGYAVKLLGDLGYRVIEATDGPEALSLLRLHPEVDLLFTDVVMPGGMSGREVAQEALRLRPGLPVLYASGYTENAIVHHGRLDPGVLLLVKPYRRADLARRLRQALSGN